MDAAELAQIRADFAAINGDTAALTGLTYNSTTELYGPPYATKAARVAVEVHSLASLHDPDLQSYALGHDISFEQYRQVTAAYSSKWTARAGDRWTVRGHEYEIVEAVQPDETEVFQIVTHCRKLGTP
jgi:hypothetical protein